MNGMEKDMFQIGAEDTWLLLAVIMATVAVAVWLESKYKWAVKVSALVIVLLLSICFSNLHLIPAKAPVYDFVEEYFLPLSLPLLLYQSDIRRICRESGQLMVAFLIGAMGTVAGAFAAYFLFQNFIPELPGISAMMTGTYVGGSVNFAVLSDSFHVSAKSISAATIADNLNMAIYFFVLLAIPVRGQANKKGKSTTPYISKEKTNPLTVRSLAVGVAVAIGIIVCSDILSNTLSQMIPTSNPLFMALQSLLGNRYLWITTCSVLCATMFPQRLGKLPGVQEIGTFFIYCFIFVIGAPASISEIVRKSPLMLLFAMLIIAFNMLFTFAGGALLGMDRKILILASNANIGGPTTAASMAIAKGWHDLVGPVLLIGCFGYVIGNYLGIIVGNALL